MNGRLPVLKTADELAVMLGRYTEDGQPDRRLVYRLTADNGMPVHKLGRSSYYDPAEVAAWLEAQRRAA